MNVEDALYQPPELIRGSPPAIGGILERYLSGKLSAPVTLMQLLIETEDSKRVRETVASLSRHAALGNSSPIHQERVRELERLTLANAPGCERIAAMLRSNMDSPHPARSVEEGIAFCEKLFDWSVQQSEEASVAMYSLGNPELLDQATTEIVEKLHDWGAITTDTELLDIGCGIGRLLTALAPEVARATGVDVSAEMVKAARRRCAGFDNVEVVKGDGRGLVEFADASFDTAIAVDSFPYLRQSGYPLVQRFFADIRRVLRKEGQLVILNYSYSEDDTADLGEVRTLALENDFEVRIAGERPFSLWDGVAFQLVRK